MTASSRLLGCLTAVGCALAALAVEPPSVAGEAFVAGERAFRQDDYVLALAQFREALRLAPHDAVRFNIAVCLERLGRFREAFLEYEAVLTSQTLDAKAKQRASEQAARVRERLATLANDEPHVIARAGDASCEGPCTLLLDPGSYEVIFETQPVSSVAVTLRRGESTVVRAPQVSPPRGEVHPRLRLGAATWVGGAVAVVGLGLFSGFGVRATQLHSAYLAAPTADVRTEGVLMRDLANVSLGTALVGLAVMVLDLVWWSRPASL